MMPPIRDGGPSFRRRAHALTDYHDHAYAVLRTVTGFLFLCHGMQKLFGVPAPVPEYSPPVLWIAGTINLLGGGLVMVGLLTRPAAILSSGLMAVAYWWLFGWRTPLPIANGGELDVLYCFVFLYIAARGGGRWSVDALRRRARGPESSIRT